MKPLILAFIMLINCQGTENKSCDEYNRHQEIELIINDFVENLIQVVGGDNRIQVTFIGINEDGDLFVEEDEIDEDDVERFLQELEG